VLRYRAGDWNALRRHLFGDLVFSLQVVVGLDEYGTDYTGGEFPLVERRSRAQSRGASTVLPPRPRPDLHYPRPPGCVSPAAGPPPRSAGASAPSAPAAATP